MTKNWWCPVLLVVFFPVTLAVLFYLGMTEALLWGLRKMGYDL